MRKTYVSMHTLISRATEFFEIQIHFIAQESNIQSAYAPVTRRSHRKDRDLDYCVVNIKCHAPIRNIRIESIPSTDRGDYTRFQAGTDGTEGIKLAQVKSEGVGLPYRVFTPVPGTVVHHFKMNHPILSETKFTIT